MSGNPKFPLLVDPAFEYASTRGHISNELIAVCKLDMRHCGESEATQAYEVARREAESGSALAMCICSRFCLKGWGSQQSDEHSFEWAKKAAATEFAPGLFELGTHYERGIGVSKNLDRARQLYELAADREFGFAASHLAMLHHSGQFGVRDMRKALEFAKRAFDLKDSMAPCTIATWYETGDGVIKNEREAAVWYERAAELGNFFASNRLYRAYLMGELGLPRNEQLAEKYSAAFDAQLP